MKIILMTYHQYMAAAQMLGVRPGAYRTCASLVLHFICWGVAWVEFPLRGREESIDSGRAHRSLMGHREPQELSGMAAFTSFSFVSQLWLT